jgi:hypothetical protein
MFKIRVPRWTLKISGTLDKFLTKFQEVPRKLKNIFKKFQEALKIFGQILGDSRNSRRSGNPVADTKSYLKPKNI